MVASGSAPRRTTIHPLLALVAFLAGWLSMLLLAGLAVARFGLHAGLTIGETLLAAPGLLLIVLSGVSLKEGLGLLRVSARAAALSVAGGAALWAASLGLMNLQFVVWAPPSPFLDMFRALHEQLRPRTVGEGLLSVLAIALMPALCEETLFRGVVLPSLARFGAAASLLGSSALFALIHIDVVGTPPAFYFYRLPFAFTVGLGMGALRVITGSLLPSMLAHAVLNTITFLTVFLTGAASEAVDEPQLFTGLLLFAAGGAFATWIFRRLRSLTPPEAPPRLAP
jgi:sodium transport system permease protein